MKIRTPAYYQNFRCIAGACPDTCCRGWAIVVDDAAWERYQTLPGEIGARLRSALTRQDSDRVIGCGADGRCRMLDADGLCSLQRACGEEALCQTCRRFPRFVTEIGQNREVGLSLSCPEAARLILSQDAPVQFFLHTTDEAVTICHDVDADFYFQLKRARDQIIGLLQARTQPVPVRVQLVNELCCRLQRCQGRFARQTMEQVLDTPMSPPCRAAYPQGLTQRQILLRMLAARSPRRADWPQRLLEAAAEIDRLLASAYALELITEFNEFCRGTEVLQEQLLVYYVNKYLIRAAFDRDIAGAARYCLASWAVIRQLAFTQWLQGIDPDWDGEQAPQGRTPDWITLCQQYAAETENDEEGRAALCRYLRRLPRRKMQDLLGGEWLLDGE